MITSFDITLGKLLKYAEQWESERGGEFSLTNLGEMLSGGNLREFFKFVHHFADSEQVEKHVETHGLNKVIEIVSDAVGKLLLGKESDPPSQSQKPKKEVL